MQANPRTEKTFAQLLVPLSQLSLDREEAILELQGIIKSFPKKDIVKTIDKLGGFPASQLTNLYASCQNRASIPEYQGFKLREKVRYIGIQYYRLSEVPLTIVEFDQPWVVCLRPSGSYAPGITIREITRL